ncbi:hypothetical protein [Kitasatospora sp. NPDC091276]|uniref:hypothetical protein n=1 Tax=Kitasatospora sp. NPDC091276 TaxID=3155300 RepID=UPI003436A23C
MRFVYAHPARLYAVVSATVALVAYYVPGLPVALVLALAAALLGTGEAVQRWEDAKTAAAGIVVAREANDHYDQHQDDDRDQAPAHVGPFEV